MPFLRGFGHVQAPVLFFMRPCHLWWRDRQISLLSLLGRVFMRLDWHGGSLCCQYSTGVAQSSHSPFESLRANDDELKSGYSVHPERGSEIRRRSMTSIWPTAHLSVTGNLVMTAEMNEERKNRMDYWWIIAVIVAWVVLQAYILPKFGIST